MFRLGFQASVQSTVHARTKARCSALAVALLVSLGSCMACSQQAEGDRCDTANKNGDCESGLICVPLSQLHRGTEGAVCCPQDNATADVCLKLDLEDSTPNSSPAQPSASPTDAPSSSAPSNSGATPLGSGPTDAGANDTSNPNAPLDSGADASVMDASSAN